MSRDEVRIVNLDAVLKNDLVYAATSAGWRMIHLLVEWVHLVGGRSTGALGAGTLLGPGLLPFSQS